MKTINPTPVALPRDLALAMKDCARPKAILSLARFKLWHRLDWAIEIRRVVASPSGLAAYQGEWTLANKFDPRTHRPYHRVPLDNREMASLIKMREVFMLKIAASLLPPIEVEPSRLEEARLECSHDWAVKCDLTGREFTVCTLCGTTKEHS